MDNKMKTALKKTCAVMGIVGIAILAIVLLYMGTAKMEYRPMQISDHDLQFVDDNSAMQQTLNITQPHEIAWGHRPILIPISNDSQSYVIGKAYDHLPTGEIVEVNLTN